ncbi:3-oxoadipate enol-lactonase [soil metagenome]
MIPAITAVRMSGASTRSDLPLLVLGPSLGTSATALWTECAEGLTDYFDVLAWDLPGHGYNRGVPEEAFTMAELAAGVLQVVDEVLVQRSELGDGAGGPFAYAGVSVGGAVGLQLLLDAPDRVAGAVLLCTGAKIGEAEGWADRIDQVSASGTSVLVSASAGRWFAPGFLDRRPEVGSALLTALADAVDTGYAQVCGALASYDVRDRLDEVVAPVLAVAGDADQATPTDDLRRIVEGVADGRLEVLADVAHLAPAEAPEAVAALIREHVLGEDPLARPPSGPEPGERYAEGLVVRREVLGDAHVDRAIAATTDLTADFQQLITEYAWGSVWTRPGLDRRSRSLITLTALVAGGHHDELAMHLRAARTNGLSVDEIRECLLQTAIYCGVPAANTAYRIAQQVLEDPTAPSDDAS